MALQLEELEPGTPRHALLASAIDFKRSWVHLARALAEAAREGLFRAWGFRTLEAYAQHELHLRRETTQKLVRSFDFLAANERGLLRAAEAEDQVVPLPGYQAVDILREAQTNPYLSEEDYREIRDQVFREDPSPNALRKLVRERAPEPPKKEALDPTEGLRRCLKLAERLYGLLLEENAPPGVCRSVEDAVGGLRKALGE